MDVILLLVIAGFVFYGIFFGFIRAIGSLAGLIIGAWVAVFGYEVAYQYIQNMAFGYDVLGKTVTFFVIFTITNRLVVLGFAILDRTFDFFSIIPFLKTINRLAGAVFGLVEGGILLGFVLYLVQSFTLTQQLIERFGANSQIIPYLVRFVEILRPIMPHVLDQLKQLV